MPGSIAAPPTCPGPDRTRDFPEWNEAWKAAIFELELEQQHLTCSETMEGSSKKVGLLANSSRLHVQICVSRVAVHAYLCS